jgi:hypothetical protein
MTLREKLAVVGPTWTAHPLELGLQAEAAAGAVNDRIGIEP